MTTKKTGRTTRKSVKSATSTTGNKAKNEKSAGGGFLTEEAFAEWTKSRDEFGACYAWFMKGTDRLGRTCLRRIANWLGGGGGLILSEADWHFKSIVVDGKSPEEVFGRNLVEDVRKTASHIGPLEQFYLRYVVWGENFQEAYSHRLEHALRQREKGSLQPRDEVIARVLEDGEELEVVLRSLGVDPKVVADRFKSLEVELSFESEREFVIYELVVRGDDPEEVFARREVAREDVEKRLLCRPLTVEEQEKFVRCDGDPVVCHTCGETFQPIVAHRILKDLTRVSPSRLDGCLAGDNSGLFAVGSWLNFCDDNGLLVPRPFHGPHLPVGSDHFQGVNCLMEARKYYTNAQELDNLVSGMSFERALALAEAENGEVRREQKVQTELRKLKVNRRNLAGGGASGGKLDLPSGRQDRRDRGRRGRRR